MMGAYRVMSILDGELSVISQYTMRPIDLGEYIVIDDSVIMFLCSDELVSDLPLREKTLLEIDRVYYVVSVVSCVGITPFGGELQDVFCRRITDDEASVLSIISL